MDPEDLNEENLHPIQKKINEKGLNLKLNDDGCSVNIKAQMGFSNKGKRRRSDYHPTDEELALIHQYTMTDTAREEQYSFALQILDTQVDRQFDAMTPKGLRAGTELPKGKAFLVDHDWTTKSTIGTIYDAAVVGNKLIHKVFVPNTPENSALLNNIFAGVYNKASAGFSTFYKDMLCSSCKKSIVFEGCPHQPGMVDENGQMVHTMLDDIADWYEDSIVPVPAQRDAGIRRMSMEEKSSKELTRKKLEILEETLNSALKSNDLTKAIETIKVTYNSLSEFTISEETYVPTEFGKGFEKSIKELSEVLDPLTTKGDLVGTDGTDSVRLPVGNAGQVLTVNSCDQGIEWKDDVTTASKAYENLSESMQLSVDAAINAERPEIIENPEVLLKDLGELLIPDTIIIDKENSKDTIVDQELEKTVEQEETVAAVEAPVVEEQVSEPAAEVVEPAVEAKVEEKSVEANPMEALVDAINSLKTSVEKLNESVDAQKAAFEESKKVDEEKVNAQEKRLSLLQEAVELATCKTLESVETGVVVTKSIEPGTNAWLLEMNNAFLGGQE